MLVGMSAKMVEHYCRNADMRANSRAALTHLERASGSSPLAQNHNSLAGSSETGRKLVA